MPYAYCVGSCIAPRSSTTTERDVRAVSSFAIVRPVQPPPMITTSTGLSVVVGCLLTLILPRRGLVLRDLLEAGRRRTKRLAVVHVDVVSIGHARAGKPDQLPAD